MLTWLALPTRWRLRRLRLSSYGPADETAQAMGSGVGLDVTGDCRGRGDGTAGELRAHRAQSPVEAHLPAGALRCRARVAEASERAGLLRLADFSVRAP